MWLEYFYYILQTEKSYFWSAINLVKNISSTVYRKALLLVTTATKSAYIQPNHIYGTLFLGQFWTDSLVHDVNALKLLVDVIGEV